VSLVASCVASIAILLVPAPSGAKDLPPAEQLPSVKELPDPFVFADGSRVKTAQDWERRRQELKDLVLGYEYGRMPPPPGNVKAKELLAVKDGAAGKSVTVEKHYLLTMGPGQKVQTHLRLYIPAMVADGGDQKSKFPVIVRGDMCWGRLDPAIAAEANRRGYMVAEFDRTEIATDNNDRSKGAYPVYGDEYDWRALSAWAWGFHRVVDYLLTRDDVDTERVIVTGHSRGGKTALLAGATDERIALTVPNNSGCGGAGCYRFQAPKSEDIAAITKNFPFWFSPQFPQFIGKIDRLPFDQHSVKALVAPRALLSTEALGDLWANPEGSQQSHLAAREVFEFLGAGDKIGIYFREGDHEHNLEDWRVLMDFADKTLSGKAVERDFNRKAFPDSPKSYSWSAPAKQ
jgi:pimeloyl-ACP methyl ester carboxylesterase